MARKIGYLTTSRADFGIVAEWLKKLDNHDAFELHVLVSGTHLDPRYGYTMHEIESYHYKRVYPIPLDDFESTPIGVCRATAQYHERIPKALEGLGLEALVLLGDRYEILAAAAVAQQLRIPIVHLHGGEITLGANDDAFRHAITKLSALHFTSTERYRHRVIQMGEHPDSVFYVGALGVENAQGVIQMSKEALFQELKLPLDKPLCLVTYHPETATQRGDYLNYVLSDIEQFARFATVVLTKSNADAGGMAINLAFESLAQGNDAIYLFSSLGTQRFMNLIRHAAFVYGNSSAGIIEVPCFGVPSMSVGTRQWGREHSALVKYYEYGDASILEDARAHCRRSNPLQAVNPYAAPIEGFKSSELMTDILLRHWDTLKNRGYKTFYDLP